MAQLAGEFRRPERDLPRAMALAFGVVAVLYVGLAVATIAVTAAGGSKVPLADLVAVGFGRAGRDATAVLAVALTMGTMNVYMGGSAKLAAALAQDGALPRWLAGDAQRSIPRRPLLVLAFTGTLVLLALGAGFSNAADLVRATSACFVAVYLAVARVGRAHPRRTDPRRRDRLARARRRRRAVLRAVPARAARRGARRSRRSPRL